MSPRNSEHRNARGAYLVRFKRAAVKRLTKETPREIAASLNISLSSLTEWKHRYGYNRKASKAAIRAARIRAAEKASRPPRTL